MLALGLIAGCATTTLSPPEATRLAALLPADALLLGEQHDAPEHQQLERRTTEWLAARGELAALAIEMAEQGRSTAGLPRSASEAEVRAALAWPEQAWPWASYGPVVMAAVRAGVPVLGANLPRTRLREAMADTTLDTRLPPAALKAQAERIREGHCNALPETQIRPMTRIQIARDLAMAEVLSSARTPGRTVLLVAGNGHVQRGLGVPAHLGADIRSKVLSAHAESAQAATENAATTSLGSPSGALQAADLVWRTPPVPPRDHCAAFRKPLNPAR